MQEWKKKLIQTGWLETLGTDRIIELVALAKIKKQCTTCVSYTVQDLTVKLPWH